MPEELPPGGRGLERVEVGLGAEPRPQVEGSVLVEVDGAVVQVNVRHGVGVGGQLAQERVGRGRELQLVQLVLSFCNRGDGKTNY